MNKPYGTNIQINPISKNKIIGDTSKYYLYGEVLGKGGAVSDEIEVGDQIAYTQWGINKVIYEDGTERFFVQDNPDFILEVIKKNESNA